MKKYIVTYSHEYGVDTYYIETSDEFNIFEFTEDSDEYQDLMEELGINREVGEMVEISLLDSNPIFKNVDHIFL